MRTRSIPVLYTSSTHSSMDSFVLTTPETSSSPIPEPDWAFCSSKREVVRRWWCGGSRKDEVRGTEGHYSFILYICSLVLSLFFFAQTGITTPFGMRIRNTIRHSQRSIKRWIFSQPRQSLSVPQAGTQLGNK